MDQEKKSEKLYQSANLNPIPKCSDHSLETAETDSLLELTLGIQPYNSGSKRRLQDDIDANNAIVARKIQKADREKLRRDKLNEHFQELGYVLDGHKNDKAIIVTDAIRALKDLTSEVSRLQSEHAALHQESNEETSAGNN
ncbi:hypothetical protein ACH5RR_011871 [Cinchona calisaya]|uniref:BHLH domain-containing protein n=1 Tax=Cinchona calisaya TaxID=153742 RepID=A0ABD3A9L1_9GENT